MMTYVSYAALFAISFFEVWLCYQLLFATVIDRKKLGVGEKISIVVSIIVIGIHLASNRMLLFFSHNELIFIIVITFVWSALVFRKKLLLLIELETIFYTVVSLIDFTFAFLAMSFLGNNFIELVYYHTISSWNILIYLCTRVIIGGILLIFVKKKKRYLHIMEYRILLLPICGIICVILRIFQVILSQMTEKDLPVRGWSMSISLLCILLVGAFCLLLLLKNISIQKEKEILTVRDELLEKRYQEMELLVEENRHITHDINNHILALNGLCKNENIEGIQNYLQEMGRDFFEISEKKWTGNETLDMLLNQKKVEAERQKILFEINSTFICELPLSDKELASLFGNLLDNAIEACQGMESKNQFIKIQIERKYYLVNLIIKNSIEKIPIIKNGEIVSTKMDGKAHGYGLKNVKRIIEKYEGVMSLRADEEQFIVSISFFL